MFLVCRVREIRSCYLYSRGSAKCRILVCSFPHYRQLHCKHHMPALGELPTHQVQTDQKRRSIIDVVELVSRIEVWFPVGSFWVAVNSYSSEAAKCDTATHLPEKYCTTVMYWCVALLVDISGSFQRPTSSLTRILPNPPTTNRNPRGALCDLVWRWN